MLDENKPLIAVIGWFVVGTIVAGIIQFAGIADSGGAASLLRAGREHPLAGVIGSELGEEALEPGVGHDGQLFYAIGLDLLGTFVPDQMVPREFPAYRYRRIAYPAIASLGGLLDGPALLWGMIATSALAMGVAAAACASIALQTGMRPWLAVAVVANPGVWISAGMLTADHIALAFGLVAIALFLRQRYGWSGVALAVTMLTKEPFLAIAVALIGYIWWGKRRRRTALGLAAASGLPLAAWMGYLAIRLGDTLTGSGNLVPPGLGIIQAAPTWTDRSFVELAWTGIVIAAAVMALWVLRTGAPLWRWLAWPWLAVGLVASRWVWDFGNNTIRTLSPLVTFTALGVASVFIDRRGDRLGDSTKSPPDGLRSTRASP